MSEGYEEVTEFLEFGFILAVVFLVLGLYEFWGPRNPVQGCLYWITGLITVNTKIRLEKEEKRNE